jgi:hypothetical protein
MAAPRRTATPALILHAPRYEVRILPIQRRTGPRIHGCFDTFTQTWRSGPLARTVAERTVRDVNRTYEGEDGEPLVRLIEGWEEAE